MTKNNFLAGSINFKDRNSLSKILNDSSVEAELPKFLYKAQK